ncbi:MAG: hypothetical protein ABI639_10570 [Thermoanaerobaculia bacterium]
MPSHGHSGESLGRVDFEVSCTPPAQVEFNRAVALLHHMTYPQAREAFAQVSVTDPACAMAHWGVAMTLFQPLWPTRPGPDALQRGWKEVERAQELAALSPVSERERLFIAAAEAFFLEPAGTDYWLRIRRWEGASEKTYQALPDDDEAAVFFALAHLATTPSSVISREHADRAAAILLEVYKRNPDHPGVMHYLVHANDVPGRERESLEITRKYEQVAPHKAHALHMPTHIYTRLGDWDGVIRGNLRAAEAALAQPAGDNGELVSDEFPHAIEYLVYAYLQQGEDSKAAAEIRRLQSTTHLEPTFKTAFHFVSTQARAALERQDWEAAFGIAPRQPSSLDWDRFAWPEAVAHFARGLGAAHLGKLFEARAEDTRLTELETAMTKAGEELFRRNIRILRLELEAWIAHAEGKEEASLAGLREAVEIETSTPKHAVTPGPTLPANELLGDLFMEQKKPAAALIAYRLSLDAYPRRFRSLLGAARAARAAGGNDAVATARKFYDELLTVASRGTRTKELQEAHRFVRSGR